MSLLRIYDASGTIYTGQTNGFGSRSSYKGIPTGGLFLLLQRLGECEQRDIPFIVAVDSPTNKRLTLPEYKGGRPRDPKVVFQNRLFHKYFGQSNKNVHKVEGKEADTLIAKAVKDNYRDDLRIDIIGADYDLAHNVDNLGLVRCVPANSKVGLVDRWNFEDMFSNNDVKVLFNSISMSKVFLGDSSDGIKHFEHQYPPEKLFAFFLGTSLKSGYKNDMLKSLECVENFLVKGAPVLGEEGLSEVKKRVQVIYPHEHLVNEDLSYRADLSTKESMSILLSLTGCKRLAERLDIKYYEDMGSMQQDATKMYLECNEINKSRHFVSDAATGDFTNGRGF